MRITPSIEHLESRQLLAFALNVNFQPASASVPAGYVADSGATYANRGNGYTYGWNSGASSMTRDRNSAASPDQRYDTLIHTQLYGSRTWEVAVPNGSYSVRIVGGDPKYTDSTIRLAAENVIVADGKLSSSQHFIEGVKTVNVTDGKLTISNASGAINNKLCFVQVTPTDVNPNTVSISAIDSSASESGPNSGAFRVTRTGSTSSALTVNYFIGGSADNGVDYNTLDGDITIAAGATSANITITPKSDGIAEGTETVTLSVQPPTGYGLMNSTATVNISDASTPITGNWPSSWTVGPTIPKARWESSSVLMDGKIWVFGGWMAASSTGTQQVDVYDIAANKWTTLGYAPIPHTHSLPVEDAANHVIYFLGGLFGSYPGIPTNRVWKYNTLTKVWSELPPMPENHSSGGVALVNGELHYIGGVQDDRDLNVGRHIYLDLDNLAAGWKVAADLPDPRDHFGCIVLGGKIYAIGGEFGHDITHDQQALVDRYDPVSKTWQRLASMPVAKSHFECSTFILNGKIVAAGGQIGDYKSTDDVSMYDPATNKWSTLGKLPAPLQGPVVQQYGNKIIVTTGNKGSGPINNTWIGILS
jgi:N-acetylneuraminic acid mutarotase